MADDASIVKTQKLTGYFLAAFGTLLFSTRGIAAKLAYANGAASLDPITILALRMAFSLPIFLVIGFIAWRKLLKDSETPPSKWVILQICIVGLLGYYLSSFLSFAGLQYVTAQVERLVLFTYPFIVMIFAWLFFGGRLRSFGLIAFVISYSGLILVFWRYLGGFGDEIDTDFLFGALLVLGAATTFALYQLLAKKFVSQIGSRAYTALAMVSAVVGVLVHFIIEKTPVGSFETIATLPPIAFGFGLYIAIFATVLPSFMLNHALGQIGAEAVGMAGTIGPVFTIILAIFILGEPFGVTEALGTALVLLAVGYYTYQDRKLRE